MNSISPYDEALRIIKQHPGTSGAAGLAKLVLSLYNATCGYAFRECVDSLDDRLTALSLRLVQHYAANGETEDLQAAGKIIADDLYPGLWEMGVAMGEAREATRRKWKEEEAALEEKKIVESEKAFISDPSRRAIPPSIAEEMIESTGEQLDSFFYSYRDWRRKSLTRDQVQAAIREHGTGFVNWNPESGYMLGVIVDGRLYYLYADYDVREQYLESIQAP